MTLFHVSEYFFRGPLFARSPTNITAGSISWEYEMIYSPMILLKQEVFLPQHTAEIKGHGVNSITEDWNTMRQSRESRTHTEDHQHKQPWVRERRHFPHYHPEPREPLTWEQTEVQTIVRKSGCTLVDQNFRESAIATDQSPDKGLKAPPSIYTTEQS